LYFLSQDFQDIGMFDISPGDFIHPLLIGFKPGFLPPMRELLPPLIPGLPRLKNIIGEPIFSPENTRLPDGYGFYISPRIPASDAVRPFVRQFIVDCGG
jgi:hypothetical protein